MTDESLSYEIYGLVGLIRINRPEKLGAFTLPMIDKWASALTTAKEDDAVRAVVLTGTGRGFCTGVDLDEIDAAGASPIAGKRLLTEHVEGLQPQRGRRKFFPVPAPAPEIAGRGVEASA